VHHHFYPTNALERTKAAEQALRRCGDLRYKVSQNNCEHLVTEILTGKAVSRQLEEESTLVAAILFDITLGKIHIEVLKFVTRLLLN